MPMTTEQRIELLKKAREKKAQIKAEMDAQKPTPVKGRPPKKTVKETKSLDLTEEEEKVEKVEEVKEVKKVEEVKEESDVEIEEQIIYEKPKKKKKKIIRKIIRQAEESESDVEEEIIYEKPPRRTQLHRPKPVEEPRHETPPREPPVRNLFFNY
tara:strand:- start:958 stop:1422 length:465 start_codon:yes stop_codon:yes gene_type:complete